MFTQAAGRRIAGGVVGTALAAATMVTPMAQAFTLVQDGKPVATIVIAEAAFKAEPMKPARGTAAPVESRIKLAALDLQAYVEKMSGAKLPLVADTAPVDAPAVLVGRSKLTAALGGVQIPAGLTPERHEEAFIIVAKGNRLVLAGNDDGPYLGSYYAVAEFLRRQGVRWIMPSELGDVVPKLATIAWDDKLSVSEKPSFRLRTWWCNQPADMGTQECLWKIRNKMQIADGDLIGIPGDSWLRNYLPEPKLAETKPELFGKRLDQTPEPYMPNLSNPDAAHAVAEKVLAAIRKGEAEGKKPHSLGFAPDDGLPMDHTPKTMQELHQGFVDWVGREGVAAEQSITEEWIQFVNRVADEVCKVYPDFILTTNGYANRALPPEGLKLHPNLGIMTAFIWADTVKPVNSPRSWHGQVMGADLKRWCELCPRVFMYEYNLTMLVTLLTPLPQVQKMAVNYPFYKKCGMIGFFNEARQPYMEEGILTRYMRAQLMWNTDLDVTAALADFGRAWYGPAATPGLAFWKAIEDCLLAKPSLGHEDRVLAFMYDDPLLARLETLCAEAEKLAAAEPYKTRISIDRLTLEHMKCYMAHKAAEFDARWEDASKQAARMIELRVALNKVSPFLSMPASREGLERYYGGDFYWGALDRRDYFQKLQAMTTGKQGKLVVLAPKTARFSLDVGGVGKSLRWYAPEYDRTNWRDIETTKPYYLQGYLAPDGIPQYTGKMWYVLEVDVPAEFAGKPVRLYTPFVNCEAWAWVNGEYAGYRKYLEAYISPAPFEADITASVKPGKKNLVAFWVNTGVNRTQAPEGILGRVFLYSPTDPNTKLDGK